MDTSVASPISLDALKGDPRIVLSVIGEYSKLVHGYNKKDKETLLKSFKNISIRAGSMYWNVNVYCIQCILTTMYIKVNISYYTFLQTCTNQVAFS